MENNFPYTRAFLSCSLRDDDNSFVRIVESILKTHNIIPFGTVGMYDQSPQNVAVTMRENIKQADIIVIVATSRYFQKDVHTGFTTSGLSEMIHAESGLAFANDKPIVVFVQKGTNVGNFLPNVTQYITLDGTQPDLDSKWIQICKLLQNAIRMSIEHQQQKSTNGLWKLFTGGLAIVGGIKVWEY